MKSKTDVENTIISGSSLMLLTRLVVKSIGVISSLILARLLIPEDFGLIAIAMAFYTFIDLFGQFGFGTVLIQEQSATKQDYDTAWTFRIIFGVIVAFIMVISGPYISGFYQDQRLTDIMYALALISILGGAQNIGVIDFQKNFQFNKELWFQIMPKFLSFIVTITMAFYLKSYWALVIGMVFNQLLSAILSYIMHSYKPNITLKSFKKLFRFSKWLMLNNFLFFLNTRLTELLIGKYVSTSATGVFSLSNEIASIPMTEIAAPINKASFPVYSKLADDKSKLRSAYLSTLKLSALLTLPASCGIFLIADLFVNVMLGDKWLEVAPIMQWVALASLLFSLTTNNNYIYMACGFPNITFYLGLFRIAIFLPLFIYLMQMNGVVGAGQALFITSIIMFLVTQLSLVYFLKLKIIRIFRTIFSSLFATIGMYLTLTALINRIQLISETVQLITVTLTGVGIYSLIVILVWYLSGKPGGIEHNMLLNIKKALIKLGLVKGS